MSTGTTSAAPVHDIVVIDLDFHQRTRSTHFFMDLVAGEGTRVLYCDPSKDDVLSLLRAHPCRSLVFMQIQPKPRLLRALRHPNVTWVPMRDDLRHDASRVRQLQGSGLKFINFCRESHEVFSARGQPSLSLSYWTAPQPAPRRSERVHPRLFLWDRGQVQWPDLKRLIGDQPVDSVVLRLAPDPGLACVRPDAQDIRRYRIELVEGWLDHADYLALLRDCDVFVAPRRLEGIGMATLEAMGSGQPVLAPDRATMNEYVVHGRNGWLYDPDRPAPVDLSEWRLRGRTAWEDSVAGAAAWARQQAEVRPFVLAPSPRRERLWWRLAKGLGL